MRDALKIGDAGTDKIVSEYRDRAAVKARAIHRSANDFQMDRAKVHEIMSFVIRTELAYIGR